MQESEDGSRTRNAVTARSIIIGVVLIPVNAYWLMVMDVEKHVGVVTKMSMFYNSVGLLFALCLLNMLLRKLRPSIAFRATELLVIYSIVTLGTAIGGIDMMEALVPTMAHAYWFATPENRWEDVVQPILPRRAGELLHEHDDLQVPRAPLNRATLR